MNENSPKNRKLMKQFPFLSTIFKQRMAPCGMQGKLGFDNVSIKVERADGDLMFRVADNVGHGDGSCIFSMKKDRDKQVMSQAEYLFAIGNDNTILNRQSWPLKEDDRKNLEHPIYGYYVLWSEQSGRMMTGLIASKVEYLVWVTVSAWHIDTRSDSGPAGRFGEFVERNIEVTIYLKPAQGFEKLREEANVYEHLHLTSRVLLDGAFKKDFDLIRIDGMLGELCMRFQSEVYDNGLRAMYEGFPTRGASGTFGPVKVLMADCCGYQRIQLEDSLSSVSFQIQEDGKWMYTLGPCGTLPRIRNLVNTVIKKWSNKAEFRFSCSFVPDTKVSVM